MKITVPKEIKNYVNNIDTVPLIEIKGTKWFLITEKELEILRLFLKKVDSIPETIWKKWSEKDISKTGMQGIYADRIIRNCVVKDNCECGYRFVHTQ